MHDAAAASSTLERSTCPACGARILADPQYVVWCRDCEWNLDPQPVKPAVGRRAGRRIKRADEAARAEFNRVMRDGPDADPVRHGIVLTLATPVHIVTVAVAVGAVLVVMSPFAQWWRIPAAIVLISMTFQLRPRFGKLSRRARTLSPDDAPATFALARQVAAAIGARAPQRVVINGAYNAGYGIVGLQRTRVLLLGLPLWNCLSAEDKVALLAHEMGHDANRDVRRGWYLNAAVHALHEWAMLLTPAPFFRQRRSRYRQSSGGHGILVLERLSELVLAPLAALGWILGAALDKAAQRDGQTAEYRADRFSAQVAGRAAAESLVQHLMLGDREINALRFAATRGVADVWSAQRQAVAAMPAHERERCERLARRSMQRIDESHPPSHFRLDFIRSLADADPLLDPAREAIAKVDNEIYRYAPAIAELFKR